MAPLIFFSYIDKTQRHPAAGAARRRVRLDNFHIKITNYFSSVMAVDKRRNNYLRLAGGVALCTIIIITNINAVSTKRV